MDSFGTHPWPGLHARSDSTQDERPSRRGFHDQQEWSRFVPNAVPMREEVGYNHNGTPPRDASPQVFRHSLDYRRSIETEFVQSSQDDTGEDTDTQAPRAATTVTHPSARSRYLREADRREIIRRIHNGEKQAELAREFGVTRAAICHINRNRVDILARSSRPVVHAAARHPKRSMSIAATVQRQWARQEQQKSAQLSANGSVHDLPPSVFLVSSHALTAHVATLRRRDTSSRDFRAIANRATWILIEEALASAQTRSVDSVALNGSVWPDNVSRHRPCAMVMDECGYPMLEVFRSIEPDTPTGFMTLDYDRDAYSGSPGGHVSLRKMCAPADVRSRAIFLLEAACTTALKASATIQSLVDFGVLESSIFFVTLEISAMALAEICARHPRVHIVTASVEAETRAGVGNFPERYFNTTTIHCNKLGSTADV